MAEAIISIANCDTLGLFGPRDQHLRQIRDSLEVDIRTQNQELRIQGAAESVAQATRVLERMKKMVDKTGAVESGELDRLLQGVRNDTLPGDRDTIDVFNPKRKIQPMTEGQARLVQAIKRHELTFCHGPAGTGKTYIAVAMAVEALKKEIVRKLVLVRPAVEAGEKLGFLPGDLQAKINPYLRPLLDALAEMMDFEQIKRYTEQDVIEMIPLAYMRGRTLNEAFIILDEAQNTTAAQMKMFLTRMGRGSKIVVSGDITQVDLPAHTRSGLVDATRRLKSLPAVAQVQLGNQDVVRHSLVQAIINAYEESERRDAPEGGSPDAG